MAGFPLTQGPAQIGHDLRMCRSVSLRRTLFSRARAAKDLAAKFIFSKTNKKTERRRTRAGAQFWDFVNLRPGRGLYLFLRLGKEWGG
jgi:hypothetical protein